MYYSINEKIKKIALLLDYSISNSDYLNIPIYQQKISPEEDSSEIQMGPPSMYNDIDSDDRIKNKEDIRRQGERPLKDIFYYNSRPITDTLMDFPFQDLQGKPVNDSTTSEGLNENKDTISFDPDVLIENPFRS
jgi:hypothetical protein